MSETNDLKEFDKVLFMGCISIIDNFEDNNQVHIINSEFPKGNWISATVDIEAVEKL
jgi:hypothetical protein